MKTKSKIGSLVFTGCMFIGIGIGYLLGAVNVGVLIGMGVGFIVKAIINQNELESQTKIS